VNNKSLFYNQ